MLHNAIGLVYGLYWGCTHLIQSGDKAIIGSQQSWQKLISKIVWLINLIILEFIL